MVLIDNGANRIRDLVAADIDKGELGTGGTAATAADTGLETADATTLLTLQNITVTNKAVKFDYLLDSSGGSSTTYKEFILQASGVPINYDRIVFTGVTFVSGGNKDIVITKLYSFRST